MEWVEVILGVAVGNIRLDSPDKTEFVLWAHAVLSGGL